MLVVPGQFIRQPCLASTISSFKRARIVKWSRPIYRPNVQIRQKIGRFIGQPQSMG